MQSTRLYPAQNGKRRGNTLVLIIIIAIIAVGALMFINAATSDPTGPVLQCPWVESSRIAESPAAINLPTDSQISLENEINLTVSILSEENENRGRLQLLIMPDGTVGATWNAKYKEGDLEKEFSANLGGNVDATLLYESDRGTDDSRLFFIAEGRFMLQAFTQGNARVGGGDAYVVGWIGKDLSAHGTLVLAPDKRNTKIYKWKQSARN